MSRYTCIKKCKSQSIHVSETRSQSNSHFVTCPPQELFYELKTYAHVFVNCVLSFRSMSLLAMAVDTAAERQLNADLQVCYIFISSG